MTAGKYEPTIADLMAASGKESALHQRAAAATRAQFGREVFVRGVVEISNFCRENCHYCGMRRGNRELERYRASAHELAELLIHHSPPSVTDINLQAGEDPVAVREVALPLIKMLRRETNLGVSVCLGTLEEALYAELKEAGASIYILKFETAMPASYERLEAPGTLAERVAHIRTLAASGWRVSSGFICGLPDEGPQEWLAALRLAQTLPLSGCSVSPFVPGEETPLAQHPVADVHATLNCMAALRLTRPDWVIPAVSALNICDPRMGYRRGLRAGANLATINLTPPDLRDNYVLYKRGRFIMHEEKILGALEAEGLRPSKTGLAEYWRGGARVAPAVSA